MTRNKRYYSLVVNGAEADLDIYGDICAESAWCSKDSDMSAYKLSRRLEELEGVSKINVNINSYGGEVAEGIAIYNALRRHPAEVTTRCDGMACSIASVIFMAGTERIMYAPSMLMIHNASTMAWGTAAELRKAADDSDKITSMSKAAYMASVSITEEELTALMDAETWISPAEALEWGFATQVVDDDDKDDPTQSTRSSLMGFIMAATRKGAADDDEQDDQTDTDDEADDADAAGDGEGDGGEIDTDDIDEVDADTDNDDDDAAAQADDEADDADPDDADDGTDDKKKDDDEKAAQRLRTFVQSAL